MVFRATGLPVYAPRPPRFGLGLRRIRDAAGTGLDIGHTMNTDVTKAQPDAPGGRRRVVWVGEGASG